MTPKNEQWKHGIGELAMISDIELDNLRRLTIVQDDAINQEIYLALTELKERRESSLRPATKFVKSTLFQHNDKLIEEFNEVQAAFYDYTENSLEKDKEHLIEEIVDLQFAAETKLAGLGLDEKQRMQARRKVIEKNQSRGYYCE